MHAEDRIIHFSAELIHRPVQSSKETLQKLYFDLSQIRAASYDSSDFANPNQVRFQSRRGPKTQSLALLLPDRLLMVEEWADLTLAGFLEKLTEVGSRTMEARGISMFTAHTATIRSTFALTHFDDARAFLMDHMCQQEGRIAPYFNRPLAVTGLRFVLPETAEHPGAYQLTIESFRHSKNEIFVELKGIFSKPASGAESLETVTGNIRRVREFIANEVFHFINQYDTAQETPPTV